MSTKTVKKKVEAAPETKAIATQVEATVPAAYNPSEWGVSEPLTAKDVIIPKILPMQAMSKKVTDGKASLGEFRDSLTDEVIGMAEGFGKTPKAIDFIPFFMEKVWIIFEDKTGTGKNYKVTKTVPINPENESWPFEETLSGVLIKRDRTMNFYCLNPNDLNGIPFILSFRRTSARAGQKIATTMFMKNIKAKKTPASMVLELSGTKTSNEKGTYVVMDVREKRPSTDAEVSEAFNWVKTVRSGAAKVDNSDLQAEETTYAHSGVEVESDQF